MFGFLRGWRRKSASTIDLAALIDASALTDAGVSVTWETALQCATVLACARVIAESCGQLPFKVFRDRADGGKEPAVDHPAYKLLHRRPNDVQTAMEFRETLTLHAVLTGNGYAFINRLDGRVPRELLPWRPDRVQMERTDAGLMYDLYGDRGASVMRVPASSMLHLRGPSWDGVIGLDAVKMARHAIGLAISLERTQAKFAAKGARLSGVLSTDQMLDDAALKRIKDAWLTYQGADNVGKVAVLDAGLKFTSMTMTGVDAQTLEQRRMQVEEICRALKVPPIMVGHNDKSSTYASAEQFFVAYVIHYLGPWLERWEQAVERDLLADDDAVYAKFLTAGFLKGDATARANLYASGIQQGWMTRNDARRLEDMDPLPGLDMPLAPQNMATVDEDGTITPVSAAAAPAA